MTKALKSSRLLLKNLQKLTANQLDYSEFKEKKRNIEDLRAAKSRCWSSWLWCLGAGAIGSVIRSSQTGNWKPTLVATGVAAICLPVAAVDMGLTFATIPPITAGAMFTSKAMSSRKRFGIVIPQEAEAKLYEMGMT